MSNVEEEIFYSEKEGILFWIAGYKDESEKVDDTIKMLTSCVDEFTKKTGAKKEDVSSYFIHKSSSYKNMRVFFAKVTDVPGSAFRINKDWSMQKWISA